MKALLLKVADLFSVLWRLVPEGLRRNLFTGMLVLESRGSDSAAALKRLIKIKDRLDWILNERALAYGKGEHPKHKLTQYHRFFTDHIADGQNVLDVGCGYGAVARTVATALPKSRVAGIELDRNRLEQAQSAKNPKNLTFVEGDATQAVPQGSWDIIILSNILEHINDRVGFLKRLQATTQAGRFLIRVPLFERDWQMPLRKELGINYFSDNDHKIEHTLAEFEQEMSNCDLQIAEIRTLWGEIWADCRFKKEEAVKK